MLKTPIKYILLFLSVAIGQLNASNFSLKRLYWTDTGAKLPTFEQIKKNIEPPSQGVLLSLDSLYYQPEKVSGPQKNNLALNVVFIKDYIKTLIPAMKNKNIGRFSNTTLGLSINTIEKYNKKLPNLIQEKSIEDPAALKNLNQSLEELDQIIKELENRKKELAKESFIMPGKRQARDVALFLLDTLIKLYQKCLNMQFQKKIPITQQMTKQKFEKNVNLI